MSDEAEQRPRVRPRSLLGVLRFLLKYRRQLSLAVGLLLVNICIEMFLPQILGSAITDLRLHVAGTSFPIGDYVRLFLALVLIRAGVGIILGPIRNRLIQRTLADIRAAIYESLQRLAFTYHDKSNTGEL